jgi:hypothetical protein
VGGSFLHDERETEMFKTYDAAVKLVGLGLVLAGLWAALTGLLLTLAGLMM